MKPWNTEVYSRNLKKKKPKVVKIPQKSASKFLAPLNPGPFGHFAQIKNSFEVIQQYKTVKKSAPNHLARPPPLPFCPNMKLLKRKAPKTFGRWLNTPTLQGNACIKTVFVVVFCFVFNMAPLRKLPNFRFLIHSCPANDWRNMDRLYIGDVSWLVGWSVGWSQCWGIRNVQVIHKWDGMGKQSNMLKFCKTDFRCLSWSQIGQFFLKPSVWGDFSKIFKRTKRFTS